MDFATAVSTVYKEKYATIEGRATRSEYWYGVLAYLCAYVVAGATSAVSDTLGGILMLVVVLGALVPSITSLVRRLHDTNRSGWWALLMIVPLGIIVIWIFACLQGTEGENDYGSSTSVDLSI